MITKIWTQNNNYAENLISYLDNARFCKNLNLDNYNVWYGLAPATAEVDGDDIALGEHFVAHWYEEKVKYYV